MLIFHLDPLASSIFSFLVIVALILAFVMLGSHWIRNHVYAFAAESWVIAALSAAIGFYGHYPELFIIAALTALLRGTVLPILLLRIIRDLKLNREFTPLLQPSSSLLVGGLLVVFSYALAHKIGLRLDLVNSIAVLALTTMFGMKLIGFLMLVLRTEAVSSILGLLVIENGIFLGSQILVPGMPLLLEMVILFDLLIIVSTFGLLIRYLHREIGTTSSRDLTRLVG
ncbi:hydrogenase [Halothiobacillus neapolitanus]|jgi:hydrogenase-4 component E|uniref:Hydrogenase 4 membrane component (E) n=1 Tax=Halothiobacillus neapolitanus (strain ATCC 23641 / DSM 15147 / CIP 104769 / NCIMB 8539 / c2) TaxID=555778 RepID=D0L1P2_HALNC|nr:hydrogenase [Halothiobacillus neapolitanus]ACX96615.1 hydrogenase 4 membrane component (E) [Halothiobacillus neapolitanus c2]OZB75899.1 MAG: hydrogenase [Halothiobacillus sp. 14-55-98]TDN65275.1 hydrogenase-4 component E [Halothiobacillus neapolitanus]